jgi:hypothetical protein
LCYLQHCSFCSVLPWLYSKSPLLKKINLSCKHECSHCLWAFLWQHIEIWDQEANTIVLHLLNEVIATHHVILAERFKGKCSGKKKKKNTKTLLFCGKSL